ncbi:MAG: succinylglutamate desuccinylase/aspartoacylase family protein [Cellvibrionaceae bacterium]
MTLYFSLTPKNLTSSIIQIVIISILSAQHGLANEAEFDDLGPGPSPALEPMRDKGVTKATNEINLESNESPVEASDPTKATPIGLLNNIIEPGTFRTLHWAPGFSMSSLNTPVPVLVAHGENPGKVLCMTAAVHGDELNGIEIVRRVLHDIDPSELTGTIIGMPIVNLDGFRRSSRYMSDRRDLNRYFPGNPRGSYASRVAYSLFHDVILHCDYLIDVHTGSFKRTNVPQIRGDLKNDSILEFTRHFGGLGVLSHPGGPGTLRRSAADFGIPAITIETGGPLILENDAVQDGVKGVKNALHNLGMYKSMRLWLMSQPVFYQSTWVRSTQGGILLSVVELNETIEKGQLLGRVVDPITNTSSDIISPYKGKILGKAIDQVVSPGFATFHVGIVSSEEQLSRPLPAVVKELTADDYLEPSLAAPSLVEPTTPNIDLKESAPVIILPKNIPSQQLNGLSNDSVDQLPTESIVPIGTTNEAIIEEVMPINDGDADDMGS